MSRQQRKTNATKRQKRERLVRWVELPPVDPECQLAAQFLNFVAPMGGIVRTSGVAAEG